MLRIRIDEFDPGNSPERQRKSFSLPFSPLSIIHGFSRQTFSYTKLPEEPIKLSVLKLDGSLFDIQVMQAATIADLKQAVEDVFCHMPKKGPGKISWPHVWGHFCLCYDRQKLVSETECIRNYGIKDGDQLQFLRHLSTNYKMTKKKSKKRDAVSTQQILRLSLSTSCEEKEQCDQEDIDFDDVENGRYWHFDDQDENFVGHQEHGLAHSSERWFQRSASKLARGGRIRCYSEAIPSRTPCDLFDSFKKLVGFCGMANMIMASSKPIIPPTFSFPQNKPRPQILSFLQKNIIPTKPQLLLLSPTTTTLNSLSLIAATSLALAPPTLAEEIEKAALFDFNLTLPIIMLEFLFLMFALDKIYYTPLGNFMDERDAAIKEKLSSVKDTSGEVKQLEEQATAILRAARAEIAAALTKMKKETQLEVEQKLAEGRRKVEAELQEALGNLEKQKEDTIKALDSQIAALSQDIVKKVLP
ncbi:ATP-synt_B domain-containing protein, partial [Cephalotus follicularis]